MSFLMNVVDNYVTEVAASMLFGLGYYLVKGIKKKNNKKSPDEKSTESSTSSNTNIYQSKLNVALEKWGYAKSIEEYNQMIKDHYGQTDPNEILHLIVSQGYTPNIDTYNALLLSCFHGKKFDTARTLQEEILNPVGPVIPNNYTLNILIKGLGLYYKTFFSNKINSVNENSQNLEKNESFMKNHKNLRKYSENSQKSQNSQNLQKFDDDLQNLISSFQERNISLDIITHNTIMDIYIDQSRLETALKYYENLKTQNVSLDYYSYTTLLKGIKKLKCTPSHSEQNDEHYLATAFNLLRELESTQHTHIDESFYNNLLDCCVKFNRIDKAEHLFYSLQSEGKSKLKEYSYSIMIKAYSKVYNLNKAIEIFNVLKKVKYEEFMQNFNKQNMCQAENITPGTVNNFNVDFDDSKSYRSTITTNTTNTFKSKNFKNSQKNKINNNSPYPTIITYGAMLNACIRCNNILKAEEIFFEMDKYSIKKNAFIYSTLINGYRKSHNFVKAIQLYEHLVKNMNLLLGLASNTGELEDMDKYSVLNQDFNYEEKSVKFEKNDNSQNYQNSSSNLVIFNTILDCCIECERYDKMHEIFEFLKTKKHSGKNNSCNDGPVPNIPDPDIITYSIVIKGYAKSNRVDKVLQIYQFLSDQRNKHNFSLDEYLYNSILDVFARNGDENLMKKIYYDMRENQIPVSVITYGVMIKLYTNIGDVHSANELYEELINKGIKPTVVIYQLLLKLYARKKMPYKAVDMFRNMLVMKIQPDYMIYDYMIKVCLRFAYLKEAVEFLISSVKDEFRFEEGVYDQIIDYVIADRQLENCMRKDMLVDLIKILKEKNVFISSYIIEKVDMFSNYVDAQVAGKNKNNFSNYRENNFNYAEDARTSYTKNSKYRNKFNFNKNHQNSGNYENKFSYEKENNKEFNDYDNFDDTQSYFSQFNLTGNSGLVNKINMHTLNTAKKDTYNNTYCNEEIEVEFDLNKDEKFQNEQEFILPDENTCKKEEIKEKEKTSYTNSNAKSNYKYSNDKRNFIPYNKNKNNYNQYPQYDKYDKYAKPNRHRGNNNYSNNCQEKSIYDL